MKQQKLTPEEKEGDEIMCFVDEGVLEYYQLDGFYDGEEEDQTYIIKNNMTIKSSDVRVLIRLPFPGEDQQVCTMKTTKDVCNILRMMITEIEKNEEITKKLDDY